MRATAVLAVYLALVPLAACTPEPDLETESPPEIDNVQVPIVGGTRQVSCQWPTAVGALGCTSTLVHPLVITTANHCVAGGGPRQITFGDTWSGAGVVRRVAVRRCFSNTGAAGSGLRGDFGFCVLAEPVTDVPIVPILFGCETDALKPGQMATLVGYGRLSGTTNGAGTKFAADVPIGRIMGNDILLGSNTDTACNGDSGGPAYVKLADGSWRVFGATSRGPQRCNGPTIYTMIHPFVAWMERTSGIDVTPCHDADGTWRPTAACRGFPLNPEVSNGAWPTMCQSVTRSGLGASCGAAFDGPVPDGGPVFPIPADGGATDARRDGGPPADTAPPPPDMAPDTAPLPPDAAPYTAPDAAPPDTAPRPVPPPPPAPPMTPPPVDPGCSCALGARGGPGGSAGFALLLVGIALLRRRARGRFSR